MTVWSLDFFEGVSDNRLKKVNKSNSFELLRGNLIPFWEKIFFCSNWIKLDILRYKSNILVFADWSLDFPEVVPDNRHKKVDKSNSF